MPKALFHRFFHSPFGFQLVSLSFFLFFVLGFRPPYLEGGNFGFDSEWNDLDLFPILEAGFLENSVGVKTAGLREILIEDDSGNLVKKLLPKKRDSEISYIVKSGDNVSKIAHKFGITVSTILWANTLNVKQTLRVGQRLKIPPTNGVYYKVKPGETLGEIAKLHEIELAKVYAYNKIKNNIIRSGDSIFLPEAKKVFVQRVVEKPRYWKEVKKVESIGFRLRRPTKGVLTQVYHKDHYALDIANKLNTPIYAAAGGTVIKEITGGWNYGYGTYVVIDHGNNIQTLYAHANVNKVSVGDVVKTGQLIQLMGNSGRVFGPTGIHIHFEVRIRGRKVNPINYFQ